MPPFEGKLLHLRPAAAGNHLHAHGHEHQHQHDHGQQDGEGWHSHGPFGRPHRHMPDGGEEVTLKGLLTLGVSGGLLPCPSALVVLLSAIALHRVGFGLLLIVAFSLGLAGVLTGIGLLLAYARRLADRLPVDSGAVRFLPVISACAVALMGLAVTVQSLAGGGIIRLL
ncbi:MAG TPA: sulfite exporter TauE/SafE family protein [Chloroflexota bacterium]|nr:sulfite exporter TauE/SafE family protein [Chloroflexota bacterium]